MFFLKELDADLNVEKVEEYETFEEASQKYKETKQNVEAGKGVSLESDTSPAVDIYFPPKPTDTPNHYMEQGVETIDIIEEAIGKQGAIDFIKGNIIKYLCRMDKKHKTPIDDAKKIKHYAEMLVDRLEANE